MSTATTTTQNTVPAYTVDVEPDAGTYYVSLYPFSKQLRIDHEEVRDCAGLPFQRSMMVVDRLAGDMAAGVELISPLSVEETEERNGCRAIEITLGSDDGELVTVENGIRFDRSDEGRLPGIEVDFTAEGAVVAMRVDRAAINTAELL